MKKLLSIIATTAVLLNSVVAPVSVLAQEMTPTPEPTPEATATPEATPTPEESVAPTSTPTETPSETVTPTPEETTPETTMTPEPTVEATTTPTTSSDSQSTPSQDQQISSPTSTPVISATATPTSTPNPEDNANVSVSLVTTNLFPETVQQNSIVQLITDKLDYSPTEVAVISGSGFEPAKTYNLTVSSTDDPATSTTTDITTDTNGSFTYNYQLDGNYRPNYSVVVNDGEVMVATTSFTDAALPSDTKLNQWETKPSGKWITGELQSSNSNYTEGETVPFELELGKLNTSNNPYTFSICRDYKDGTHFGYISLQPYNTSRSATPDGVVSTTNNPFSGSNISSISFTEVGGQGVCNSTERETKVSVNVTDSSKYTYVLWGGKLASPQDAGVGSGNGASSYPGGKLHMHLYSPNKDLGIQTGAIVPLAGSITLDKVTNPSADSTLFSFSTTGFSTNTSPSLGDTSTPVLWSGLSAKTYTITESSTSGWTLSNKTCSGATASVITQITNGVSISLAAGENLTCTFTNTKNVASPSINTTPNPATGNIGTTLNDSATISGGFNPTGTITFKLYGPSDSTCQNTPAFTQSINVANGNNTYSTTGGFVANMAGTWHWSALYSGDSYNNPTSSLCSEAVTIGKNSPTIATTLSATTANIGTNVHDSSVLTGTTSNAGGTVTYHAYAGANTCSGTDLLGSQVTVTNGIVPNSSNISFANAGVYSFQAVYSGDTNNNGATSICSTEQITIIKNSPTITTLLSATSVSAGSSVYDTARLSGATSTAGGTVTYRVYSDNTCSILIAGPGVKTVTNGVVPNSDEITFTEAGNYYWQANYSGDDNNNSAVSACTEEHLVVNKLTPSLSTLPTPTSAILGATISDTATLSGAYNPTGKISFSLFSPGNTTCDIRSRMGYEEVAVDGNGTYTSPTFSNTVYAGTWRWIASYSGDSNNNSVTGGCSDELVTINKADTSVTTHVYNGEGQDITNSTDVLGANIHDSATVYGEVGVIGITGTVTYNFYENGACTGRPVSTETINISGYPFTTNSSTILNIGAGSYSYMATYNGDSNYNGSTGICEPFSISKVDSSVTTEVHNSDHQDLTNQTVEPGIFVHDSSTVLGASQSFRPTGNVTYYFFTNGSCNGEPVDSETTEIGSETEPRLISESGSYSYKANYLGNENFNSSVGECEPFTVGSPAVSITKSNDSGSGVRAGSVITYTLTVSNSGSMDLSNLKVTDVLPGGFSYVTGSTSGVTTDDPTVSGAVLSWSIENLNSGESATITYKATTDSDLSDGTYTNFATCNAMYGRESMVSCNQTNSDVTIGSTFGYSGNLSGGQVLGASTELPDTGSPTILVVIGFGLLITGIGLNIVSKKRYAKK